MELATYAIESKVEQSHWWFVIRRKLIASIIRKQAIASDAPILDIGTSTGTNLRMLKELGFSNYCGLDSSEEAIRWCAEKGLGVVRKGDVCDMPFEDATFDLVLATDIIEHVDDDAKALDEIRRVLKPRGRLIVTVPAFESLWGLQDDVAHHKRRYRKQQLLDLLRGTGLQSMESFYFNYLLFVPIWLARRVIDLFQIKLRSENEVNNGFLNAVLKAIFWLDIKTAPWVRIPFGVSILLVATQPR
jgi:SAM-dependent methyltransferase